MTDPLSSQQEEDGVEKWQLFTDMEKPDSPLYNGETFCCDNSDTAGTNTSETVKIHVGKKFSVTMLTTVNRTTACSLFYKYSFASKNHYPST